MLKQLPINTSLTPENCEAKGFKWIQDIIYDREAPREAMQDIIDEIEKREYVLGEEAKDFRGDMFGLYAPIIK